MGGHEQERLSAYLDDALSPGERARVAAHVDSCAECAGRLAELAAVDGAVAALPSEAPAGYFETLPGRVRARLEPRAARRLPVWTWAAAAALLLAVVTPLTLLRRPEDASFRDARQAPAAAAPEPARTQIPPEPPKGAAAERAERKADARQLPPIASARPEKREQGFATAPAEADRLARAPAAPAVAQPAAPPPAAREKDLAEPLPAAGAMAEAVAPDAQNQAQASADEARLARGRDGAAAGMRPEAKLVSAEAEWQRLDAVRPRTAVEWRRLREEWRRFVAQGPRQALADEARVRVIEAGLAAWRSGGDPADEAAFRKDATSYLERDDALQRERVAGLLRARE